MTTSIRWLKDIWETLDDSKELWDLNDGEKDVFYSAYLKGYELLW